MSEEQILDNLAIRITFGHYHVLERSDAQRTLRKLYAGKTENLTIDQVVLDLVATFM